MLSGHECQIVERDKKGGPPVMKIPAHWLLETIRDLFKRGQNGVYLACLCIDTFSSIRGTGRHFVVYNGLWRKKGGEAGTEYGFGQLL